MVSILIILIAIVILIAIGFFVFTFLNRPEVKVAKGIGDLFG